MGKWSAWSIVPLAATLLHRLPRRKREGTAAADAAAAAAAAGHAWKHEGEERDPHPPSARGLQDSAVEGRETRKEIAEREGQRQGGAGVPDGRAEG
eukprot:3427100-Heterocapsa_arctica.AAC.1